MKFCSRYYYVMLFSDLEVQKEQISKYKSGILPIFIMKDNCLGRISPWPVQIDPSIRFYFSRSALLYHPKKN